jgi:hypothetical protein
LVFKEWDGLLINVDCQHGAANVSPVAASRIAVIDHHIQERELPVLCDLRPWLGSCSTLVWSLLAQESFAIDACLGTALHYGLFSDTNGFSEIMHPLDRDMWDALDADQSILKKLKRSNLTLHDVAFASERGILDTREGKVSYEEGDALLTGTLGESWPVARDRFMEAYMPRVTAHRRGMKEYITAVNLTIIAVKRRHGNTAAGLI